MSNHPCANKCSEFKDGGQCFYCLINETVNSGVYSTHRTEHRIDHIVEPNDMVDANAGVTVITPKGTSKVKGGLTAFVDMGDDAHIENNISPLCLSDSRKNESQSPLSIKQDALSRMESCYIEQKKHVELLQTEVTRLNSTVERLKAENKMLHEAAATHLRNQHHFMDLYNRLVEQLYPYALDLEDPSIFLESEKSRFPKEYRDGYDRARECVHYNLLEMMESDVEYIRAQCDMLGGGGEA